MYFSGILRDRYTDYKMINIPNDYKQKNSFRRSKFLMKILVASIFNQIIITKECENKFIRLPIYHYNL